MAKVTKEEMMERFRLYGEIYLLCAEINGDDYDDVDEDLCIDVDDIIDTLELPEDKKIMINMGSECHGLVKWVSVEFDDNKMLCIYFKTAEGFNCGMPVIETPSEALKVVKNFLRRYKNA